MSSADHELRPVADVAARVRSAMNDGRRDSERIAAHLDMLARQARPAVLSFGTKGRVMAASAEALELLGCRTAAEAEPVLACACPDLPRVLDSLRRSHASATVNLELEPEAEDENPRRLCIQLHHLAAAADETCIGLVTDVGAAELLQADVRLAGQLRELARAYRTIAHELKAPLSALMVNVELLRDSLQQSDPSDRPSRDRQVAYVSVLRQEITRLNRSLHDLLTHAGARVQKQELFDLRALIVDLATLVSAQARRQGVDVTTGLPVEGPILLGHRDRLKEAFLNIVVNALQAMPDGGRLVMHLQEVGKQARVTFSDSGPGIPPEVVARIYDLPGSTKMGGSGIGLYVARGLIELNGGELKVNGGPSKGATLEVILPLAPQGC